MYKLMITIWIVYLDRPSVHDILFLHLMYFGFLFNSVCYITVKLLLCILL